MEKPPTSRARELIFYRSTEYFGIGDGILLYIACPPAEHGLNNICGQKIRKLRLEMKNVSQRKLADMLQVQGLDIDKNAIQRMESGKRFITDIELKALAKVLKVTYAELLD